MLLHYDLLKQNAANKYSSWIVHARDVVLVLLKEINHPLYVVQCVLQLCATVMWFLIDGHRYSNTHHCTKFWIVIINRMHMEL